MNEQLLIPSAEMEHIENVLKEVETILTEVESNLASFIPFNVNNDIC